MIDFIWKLRAARWFYKLTDLNYIESWKYANTLLDSYNYEENKEIGPKEAVLVEISYWEE